ncbi:pyruvate formate lyase activating enzyme [Halanaerobium saccharolyticum]|uniref:Pyruvate formate lyase activating enzyme n=1 Tax=Halanaerobium saccharolyticum TaxID=43595 RepID=A0A4V3G609_9FIRM|nr:anaerobic ribonucleoside-triphosphate reductase activating protein [Halanaerobium saccharolyticum]RAK11838.1 pyruvate formate lyase activating enzyme [Halanaerobium saccharolyticum]TDW07679.1 pyruvate formate lyase activating enzyme [Halanaerobium saccharolyticum]TDX64600.1 pyruvate formate lyase activating enzyme [Halanaerobium saccharolyticum]
MAGLQKTSVIDFPDQISAVVFTQGCNFYCPYCHNSQLIPLKLPSGKELMPESYFFGFLEQRQNLLDGVTITGGEPLLQSDLKDFLFKIKNDYNLLIKLDTNGSSSSKLQKLMEADLIDYLAVDLKFSWPNYKQLAPAGLISEIKRSVELIINSDVDYEFRTTVVPGLHDIEEIEKIAIQIKGAEKYFIQNFRPVNTLDPGLTNRRSFAPSKLEQFRLTAEKHLNNVQIRD